MDTYRYQPLATSQSVRFLRVVTDRKPTEFSLGRPVKESDLEYELVPFDIDSIKNQTWAWSVPYTAVSYAWGTAPRSRKFKLRNQGYILITPSLEAAIGKIALADDSESDLIWIDQVCIDQENVAEREQQVSLMHTLYRKATNVMIWLGEEDDGSNRVTKMVQLVSKLAGQHHLKAEQRWALEALMSGNDSSLFNLKELNWDTYKKLFPKPKDHPDDTPGQNKYEVALMSYFDRPWFQRAWTFQEAVLPKNIFFLTGTERITMQGLLWTTEALGQNRMDRMLFRARQDKERAASGYESLLAIETTRYQITGEKPMREFLHFVSELAPYYKATDDRDLCYAFLGFQKNPNIKIRPDYSLTPDEVYIKTSKAIIDGSQSLDIFGVLYRGPTLATGRLLPSWAPDWLAEPRTVPLYASHIQSRFSACGKYTHSPSAGNLTVRGKVIDVVESLHATNTFPHPPLQAFDIRDITISDLFNLDTLRADLTAKWPSTEDKITPTRLLRALLADGANPGAAEVILQEEARYGLADWRLKELIDAYNSWAHIQDNLDQTDTYEAKLNAQALLAYSSVIKNRCVIATRNWLLGIAAGCVEKGDLVCILHGSCTPVILRAGASHTFTVIGQAYVEGLMLGDVVFWPEEEADSFSLV
jgi:hypothetical protein